MYSRSRGNFEATCGRVKHSAKAPARCASSRRPRRWKPRSAFHHAARTVGSALLPGHVRSRGLDALAGAQHAAADPDRRPSTVPSNPGRLCLRDRTGRGAPQTPRLRSLGGGVSGDTPRGARYQLREAQNRMAILRRSCFSCSSACSRSSCYRRRARAQCGIGYLVERCAPSADHEALPRSVIARYA